MHVPYGDGARDDKGEAVGFFDDALDSDPFLKLLCQILVYSHEEGFLAFGRVIAGKAYKAAACCGFSRVDFLLDKQSGDIYINEINAIPGFTSISMFPMLMKETGMTLPEIVDRIIELGYERYSLKNNR